MNSSLTATTRTTTSARLSGGFSLYELLTAVGIIGVMAALTFPIVARMKNGAETARDNRNASVLASTFASAQAAGAEIGEGSVQEVIDRLQEGLQGKGHFADMHFQVNIDDESVERVLGANLVFLQNGALVSAAQD